MRCSSRSSRRQPLAVDFVEASQVAASARASLSIAVPAEILEQVVVRVDAVERRVRRMRLVKVAEEVLDEMGERFGNDHGIR